MNIPIYPEHARLQFVWVETWRCGLAFLVPLSVFPTGFYKTVNRRRSSWLCKEGKRYVGWKQIQRHKMKHLSGLSGGRHFWELLSLFFFQSKGRFLVFGLSSCNFSLLNLRTDLWQTGAKQKQMVPFSKSAVCVCHSTASFMVHSLSFISPAVCLWQDFFFSSPLICFVCVCLRSLCIMFLLCLMGSLGFHICSFFSFFF